jgi:ribosome-binding ATPase YchF (GTP1/OBG family)
LRPYNNHITPPFQKEVHAWQVPEGSDIVTCAGRIHTDLARGFIKGDMAGFEDFLKCHNWNDCQRKGLVKVVDRDYIIKPGVSGKSALQLFPCD